MLATVQCHVHIYFRTCSQNCAALITRYREVTVDTGQSGQHLLKVSPWKMKNIYVYTMISSSSRGLRRDLANLDRPCFSHNRRVLPAPALCQSPFKPSAALMKPSCKPLDVQTKQRSLYWQKTHAHFKTTAHRTAYSSNWGSGAQKNKREKADPMLTMAQRWRRFY